MYLQPKLSQRLSQRQVLTPGLVQMVSVLALNKLELKEMINSEMVENPVLEELEESALSLEERAGIEGERERSAEDLAAETRTEKDPFDEIDFGSYFQDYLDPGFRTASNFEESDKPSFEHFLSAPSRLSDHLAWQLGSLTLSRPVRMATELIVGNLNETGYLTATDEELAEALVEVVRQPARNEVLPFDRGGKSRPGPWWVDHLAEKAGVAHANGLAEKPEDRNGHNAHATAIYLAAAAAQGEELDEFRVALAVMEEARGVIHQLDPLGVGARDLRECLLIQIAAQRREAALVLRRREAWATAKAKKDADVLGLEPAEMENYAAALDTSVAAPVRQADLFGVAAAIVSQHLHLLQKKDMREITHCCGRPAEEVQAAVDFIRTLDPRPGQRYNQSETRLIEPDVAFVKRDDEYVVLMNEEDLPVLRLNQGYRRMLRQKQTEKDVREYVKERYKSAIQLLRNIEQRKNTIVKTCEVIVRRQGEFLEHGESALKPMMIKEVAEEIGVHPSTVSRAVANKYVHTSQGVYELRFFFSEGVNGPEGADLPLVLLKRKVKKLIEDEDPRKPLTDDHLAAELQRQGIQVTRRTVAKYREDLQIPSTHQRRVR